MSLMPLVLKEISAQHARKQYIHCTNNFSVFQIYQRISCTTTNNFFLEAVTQGSNFSCVCFKAMIFLVRLLKSCNINNQYTNDNQCCSTCKTQVMSKARLSPDIHQQGWLLGWMLSFSCKIYRNPSYVFSK